MASRLSYLAFEGRAHRQRPFAGESLRPPRSSTSTEDSQ
jgi:hypothetical protein